MKSAPPQGWMQANRDNWDRRVPMHLGSREYDLTRLRSGQGRLYPMEHEAIGNVAGLKVLHLQCHFGRDSLVFAQQGAKVVGVDFSEPAIALAHRLAGELNLAHLSEFHVSDIYDAPNAVPGRDAFDLVYTTWGTITWLPDLTGWARTIAHFLAPGGRLFFADAHPTALVFDDMIPEPDGRPGWFLPYFHDETYVEDDPADYAGERLPVAGRVHEWQHTVSEVLSALLDAGLVINQVQEYDTIPWAMFQTLVEGEDGLFRWPDKAWFPLSWSVVARKPA